MSRVSIRTRLTVMIISILIICCTGLTIITIYSASNMAAQIASVVTPAYNTNGVIEEEPMLESAALAEINKDIQHKKEIVDNFYITSILSMIGVIIVGGVSTYYISKRALLPLIKLNTKIKECTVENLSEQLEVPKTNDEISDLAKSFNIMGDRIYEAFAFQKQFSANVAHELRTPLTILKTKIEVFNKRKDNNINEYKELTNNLENQVSRLSDIVQTLLTLTNTDVVLEKENILVSDLIDEIIIELSPIVQNKNIDISTLYEDIEIYGNIDLLYQAFFNLIENSLKYNKQDGAVIITAKNDNQGNTAIQISDTGIGIPSKDKDSVFQPFYRVDKSRSREIGGAGLGLSIVKNIVTKHNGYIYIDDDTVVGTSFIITLPKQKKMI